MVAKVLGDQIERDNGSDHRVRTIDLPFRKYAQAGLRVHHIVIWRVRALVFC